MTVYIRRSRVLGSHGTTHRRQRRRALTSDDAGVKAPIDGADMPPKDVRDVIHGRTLSVELQVHLLILSRHPCMAIFLITISGCWTLIQKISQNGLLMRDTFATARIHACRTGHVYPKPRGVCQSPEEGQAPLCRQQRDMYRRSRDVCWVPRAEVRTSGRGAIPAPASSSGRTKAAAAHRAAGPCSSVGLSRLDSGLPSGPYGEHEGKNAEQRGDEERWR